MNHLEANNILTPLQHGVGLHGNSGLDPGASVKLISTYVTPWLLYGLDSVKLAKKDIAALDAFYKQLLKRIQGLPDNTANEAVYLLLGAVPVEAIIHIKVLTLFGAISRLEGHHPLRQLALHQLAIKDEKSKSWFVYVAGIASKYDINLHQALTMAWPK